MAFALSANKPTQIYVMIVGLNLKESIKRVIHTPIIFIEILLKYHKGKVWDYGNYV